MRFYLLSKGVLDTGLTPFLTHQQPQKRWGCSDPETEPLWHSAGCPARERRTLSDRRPFWTAQLCTSLKAVGRNSPHWEPCHACCSASSWFWRECWSPLCYEHRWSVSLVCRNHLRRRRTQNTRDPLNNLHALSKRGLVYVTVWKLRLGSDNTQHRCNLNVYLIPFLLHLVSQTIIFPSLAPVQNTAVQ